MNAANTALALGGGHFAGGCVAYLATQRQCFFVSRRFRNMLYNYNTFEHIPHFRFRSYLSTKTLDLLKEQVYRFMRDQLDDPLIRPFLG